MRDAEDKDEKIAQLQLNASTSDAAFQAEKEAVERENASLQKKVSNFPSPSRHSKDVILTFWHRFNVHATLFWRRVPAGSISFPS